MSDHVVPHFHNTSGSARIEIAVKKFMCIGAIPPFDHPHVYLDMGDDDEKVCPYCSTHFVFNSQLEADQTVPEGCSYLVDAA